MVASVPGRRPTFTMLRLRDGADRAIKVYKTSILTFKDRDKYVSGEFRFRNGYCKHNPRKMVRTWAEKRNEKSDPHQRGWYSMS